MIWLELLIMLACILVTMVSSIPIAWALAMMLR